MEETVLTLIADGGSTKADWVLMRGDIRVARFHTQGVNPVILSTEEIVAILKKELLSADEFQQPEVVKFFGAGCLGAYATDLKVVLQTLMPQAREVVVDTDLIGAAHALLGDEGTGIACILGTGSNSGLFVNGELQKNVSPLGYILGDEGSGAVLGRRLLGDVLKQQLPKSVCDDFEATYHLTQADIIKKVYRMPMANRFLASFAPFLSKHLDDAAVRALVVDEFERFFRRNVANYNRPDLAVSFVGSVAYYFKNELLEAASHLGYRIGAIKKAPLD